MTPAPSSIDQRIPDRLPLLDAFVAERLPPDYRIDVDATVMIQHQLGSIVPLTEALIALGADPRRMYWVDIPYSANATVAARLAGLGIPEANFAAADYTLEQPYAAYQHRRVTELVAELRQRFGRDARLLVLDDGAYFADAAACFEGAFGSLALVEQTHRGMRKVLGDAACRTFAQGTRFVDVATSKPKLDIESPFIGDSVLRALHTALGPHRDAVAAGPALLLGYGAIGRAVATALTDGLGIPRPALRVHDPAPDKQDDAARDGFGPWDAGGPPFTRFTLVVGCSGTTSFTIGDRVFLADGAVLASTSSGAAELSREQFVELADAHAGDHVWIEDRDTLASRDIHSPIRFRLVDRSAVFLNGGFPLNFDGNVNCVPWRDIQLTRALMLAAAVQALGAPGPGIEPLAEGTCEWLTRRFGELTG